MRKNRLLPILAASLAVILFVLAGISAHSVKAEEPAEPVPETAVETAETVAVQEMEPVTESEVTEEEPAMILAEAEQESEITDEDVYELYDNESRRGWLEQDGIWYYYIDDVPVTGWQEIGGKWYYFNASGEMQTGWIKPNTAWYYLFPSGAMATGWQSIDNKWYYFSGSGAMYSAAWLKWNGKWYFLHGSGPMAVGWHLLYGKWYYFDNSGVMATGWRQLGRTWYYLRSSGEMATGWEKIGGKWYYLYSSGAMATGWVKDGGKWYYCSSSGAMQTGWIKDGSKWYYMKSSGAMAVNEWVSGYYWIGSNGVWTYKYRGSWKSNSRGVWFGDTSGWYARNTTTVIDGKTYKFDSNGYVINNDEIMNIAFLGVDTQENRSDVMMVISVNKTKNTISCVSILRDSKVKVPGCSVGTKIGYAYKWGDAWNGEGEALAMQTINNNFGTKIDKYIKMYFWDVEAVVDALGGVDIYVTEEETTVLDSLARSRGYTGEGTHEGMNHLCGLQTVAYSRIRSFGGSLAEFYRSHRQHAVINEIFKKITKMTKAEQLAFLLDVAMNNIETNINLEDLKSLTDLKMSTLKLECCSIPDGEFETDLWCGWEDTPQTQASDPELDLRQWLWIYDLSEAGGRLRSYTGN